MSTALQVTSEAGHEAIDAVEAMILGMPVSVDPNARVTHHYCRECRLNAGEIWTSKIHRTEHPFAMTAGECLVWSEDHGWQHVTAPYQGVTMPGTRRILVILQDTTWVTFHRAEEGEINLDRIEERIIEYRPIAATIPLEQLVTAALAASKPKDESWHGAM